MYACVYIYIYMYIHNGSHMGDVIVGTGFRGIV